MNCIVTAGPTYESLDDVRRLTNFSTGKFGSSLATFLTQKGHRVTLLLGHYSTYRGEQLAQEIKTFTTTDDLKMHFESLAKEEADAVFHAAAVSDFRFGKIFQRAASGDLIEIQSGKFSTREGALLAELVPTPKLISQLPRIFPHAKIVGWKYEVEGNRADVLEKARAQIRENKTHGCVANGPAYGFGFGLVCATGEPLHFSDTTGIFTALENLALKK